MTGRADVVEGRTCHGCTLCCKLLSIEELEKPPLTWCAICNAKTGCKDYTHRPTECREFYCGYLLDPALDERWKPSSCKLVVSFEEHANAVVILVDPTRHDAWRKEPFHSQIRQWVHPRLRPVIGLRVKLASRGSGRFGHGRMESHRMAGQHQNCRPPGVRDGPRRDQTGAAGAPACR